MFNQRLKKTSPYSDIAAQMQEFGGMRSFGEFDGTPEPPMPFGRSMPKLEDLRYGPQPYQGPQFMGGGGGQYDPEMIRAMIEKMSNRRGFGSQFPAPYSGVLGR